MPIISVRARSTKTGAKIAQLYIQAAQEEFAAVPLNLRPCRQPIDGPGDLRSPAL